MKVIAIEIAGREVLMSENNFKFYIEIGALKPDTPFREVPQESNESIFKIKNPDKKMPG